ncbi:MAG TPA: GMC oxidoreductase [Casimicrobiaceae bacterium]|jgi:choline dehydrogenase-like flavoprotein
MPINIVIGSGPTGVAAASALIAQGCDVLMVDVGEELEPSKALLRARMGSAQPSQWRRADLDEVTMAGRSERSSTIRPYGSDFLFRIPVAGKEWNELAGLQYPRPSFAKGGLSNGWGASMLPYREADLGGWPIRAADLAPHYDAVASIVSLAADHDDLALLFPAHRLGERQPLPLSTQARRLLGRLDSQRTRLAEEGVHFGQSRQAIADGCRLCAMCLYGCPYRLIFNAADVVDRLRGSGGLTYRPDSYAIRFEEDASGVRLWTRSAAGDVAELRGDRLFVAAGVLPTALLVLRSLDRPDYPVSLLDNQQFFLPMLHTWPADPDPSTEPRHTLAQLFIELVQPEVSAHTVHVQIYTHNDGFAADMRRRLGALADMLNPLVGMLSRHLIVAQASLHSDASPQIELVMRRSGADARLELQRRDNAETTAAVARARHSLARVARWAGLLPLTALVRLGAPGSSFHCGGSFPMRENPEVLETDVLGRPAGLRRIHLIDASVFPSIPATTITFSAMANAHRIATSVARAS